MLAFMVANWTYDSGLLEKMGLFLSEKVKSAIEDIRYWCGVGDNVGRILGAAKVIFVKAVMDPEQTNPILWWLVIIIRSQLLDSMPEFPTGVPEKHFVPNLSFDGKLEALNHYARVLTLESLLHDREHSKATGQGLAGEFLRTQDETSAFVYSQSDQRTDEGDDRIFQRLLFERFYLDSTAWQHSLKHLHGLVDAWLVHDCHGPVREILGLLDGVAVVRGDERQQDLVLFGTQPPSSPQADQFLVIAQCWKNYTERQERDPKKIDRPMTSSASPQGVYTAAIEANEKARRFIAAMVGPRSYAKRWNEHLRDDGTVRIRAVYIDLANNAKIVVWVEKQRA